MLLSLVLTCLCTLLLATVLLLTLGHRVRVASVWLSLAAVALIVLAGGEIAGRVLRLPTEHVLKAQATLLTVGVAVAFLRRRWNPVGTTFLAVLLTSSLAYVALAAWVTVAGGLSPAAAVASGLVLVLEILALLLAASFAFETCDVACRVRPDRQEPIRDPEHLPFVSLHVAAYNEPPDMLIETIQSLEAIDYPHFEIVVVDNNTVDEDVWRPVEEYCASRPRVTFVHVAPWPGFKSGALNLALTHHTDPRAELIGVVDADYLVRPDYLSANVGFFADPTMAFVQTPQDYREWQGDTYLTACYDAYKYFFASSMRSRNQRNSIIFGGTMGLIRRDVLAELGGWDEWCITEDAEVSLRMLRAGHSGHYVHEAFGRGIMPLTFSALKRQRFRWCFGGVQILRKHWRSLMPWNRAPQNRLSLAQRADYLIGGVQWFTDFVTLGFTVVLAVSTVLVLVGRPVPFRPFGGAAFLLPVVIASTGLLRAIWALRHLTGITFRRAFLAFLNWLALSWTVALACAKGLVRGEGVFLRTPKWRAGGGLGEALRETRTESGLAFLLLGASAALLATGGSGLVLPVLAMWQGSVYASAPLMAWMNLHTELSARLERRRRGEDRRERIVAIQPHVARVAVGVGLAGVLALLFLGGITSEDQPEALVVPRRDADDAGPLGNLGILPRPDSAPGDGPTTTTSGEGAGTTIGTSTSGSATTGSATTSAGATTTTTGTTTPPPAGTTPATTRPGATTTTNTAATQPEPPTTERTTPTSGGPPSSGPSDTRPGGP